MIKNLYNLYGPSMRILGYERGIARIIETLKLNLSPGSKILDIGCGTGIIGLTLLKKIKESTLLATDLDERFLRKIIIRAKNNRFENSRVTVGFSDITFPDKITLLNNSKIYLDKGSFDIITSGAVIGYSKNQGKTIKKILKLIKPGGYFINLEMNGSFLGKLISKIYYYSIMPSDSMKRIIEAEGFSFKIVPISIQNFPANLTRMCIVAQKQ